MIRLAIFVSLLVVLQETVAQRIAITFDDAPTSDGPLFTGDERARRILAHLKKHQVSEAAFFVMTSNITATNQKRLYDYVRAGHVLANHSHTHPWIHQVGVESYIRDVARADSVLSGLPGYQKWFRYPYLDEGRSVESRDAIRAALQALGLSNGYVTVDNYDWYINGLLTKAQREGRKADQDHLRTMYVDHIVSSLLFYDRIAREQLGRSPVHVLLLHENDLAALFLGDLLTHIKDRGWIIVSAREAYRDPIASRVPDVLFNGQGRVAAIAREHGVPARELVQLSEDETFLDSLAVRLKVFR